MLISLSVTLTIAVIKFKRKYFNDNSAVLF